MCVGCFFIFLDCRRVFATSRHKCSIVIASAQWVLSLFALLFVPLSFLWRRLRPHFSLSFRRCATSLSNLPFLLRVLVCDCDCACVSVL